MLTVPPVSVSWACGSFQVRFHPLIPTLIASGSLDHEVRLWDANSGECIGSRDFCKHLSEFLCAAFS